MNKFDELDLLLNKNNGYITTSEAMRIGVSRTYFGEYIRKRELEKVTQGVYMSQDAWEDGMYVIQTRYPGAVFSHETALYLHGLAEREPTQYAVTLKTTSSASGLIKSGVKVYKVKADLFEEGLCKAETPEGHKVRVYNTERTICDLVRSRNNIEVQEILSSIKEYARMNEKNIPLLMRYASLFSVEKIIRQYLEVLL
ncbi:MAG: type IV toxin-antitoxin system AbiEi family antitoxin domain-containing protein [Oscillospiraceae bacterium]|jgi:predicted transcriptional regulator of viral defense system|nr:type IV toxin-antitoxin system AbiEi family antitoxin domain-containing protein [Oscillospiraceae bacterium]